MSRKRLLLIGGGHAHLFVLEFLRNHVQEWRDKIDITLVSRELQTAYSGMLPGLIAGHYRHSECHIDLRPLADSANVALHQAEIDRLDVQGNVAFSGNRQWPFDVVSIDIGSAPPLFSIPGAGAHALTVKPIELFLHRWRELLQAINHAEKPIHLIVAGGGAGGVEVTLAMAYRLNAYRKQVKISLVTRDRLLAGYPRRVANLMMRRLTQAGVALKTHIDISGVEQGKLHFSDGCHASFDALILATGAAAQSWLASSGVESIDNGFIHVNSYLQSVSHPHVFAAGDVATDPQQRRPKAGVFAVRQGPVLAENIFRFIMGREMRRYNPQRDFLSLLSTGSQHAVASWYGLTWQGEWVWKWKSAIDKRFMHRFTKPFSDS